MSSFPPKTSPLRCAPADKPLLEAQNQARLLAYIQDFAAARKGPSGHLLPLYTEDVLLTLHTLTIQGIYTLRWRTTRCDGRCHHRRGVIHPTTRPRSTEPTPRSRRICPDQTRTVSHGTKQDQSRDRLLPPLLTHSSLFRRQRACGARFPFINAHRHGRGDHPGRIPALRYRHTVTNISRCSRQRTAAIPCPFIAS